MPSCHPAQEMEESQSHERVVRLLSDCRIVLVARIGPGAQKVLMAHGLRAYEAPVFIEDALRKLIAAGARNFTSYGGI